MTIHIHPKKMMALFLALCPFFRHYSLFGINVAMFFIVCISICMIKINLQSNNYSLINQFAGISMVIFMFIYAVVDAMIVQVDNGEQLVSSLRQIVLFFIMIIVSVNCFLDVEMRSLHNLCVENISIIMSIVIVLQYVLFYGFGVSLGHERAFLFPFQNLFIESVENYLSQSYMVIDGLFRPSAFFLEPAHYSQYCILGLASLFSTEKNFLTVKKVIISIGIFMTTSGIGIASVLAVWVLALYIENEKVTMNHVIKIVVITILMTVFFAVLYLAVPVFQSSVNRVIAPGDGYNAFEGRLGSRFLIGTLQGVSFVFGKGFRNIPTWGRLDTPYFMTGIVELMYCQGVLGTLIFLVCSLNMFRKLKRKAMLGCFLGFICALIFIVGSDWFSPLTIITFLPFLFTGPLLIRTLQMKKGGKNEGRKKGMLSNSYIQ